MDLGELYKVACSLREVNPQLAFQAQTVLGSLLDEQLLMGTQAVPVSGSEVILFETPRGCCIWIDLQEFKIVGLNPKIRPVKPN